jgi:hypothetical protein
VDRPDQVQSPRRGVWGGPPGGGEPPAIAARDLAFVARDQPLRSFLKKELADETALPGDPVKVDPYPRALNNGARPAARTPAPPRRSTPARP